MTDRERVEQVRRLLRADRPLERGGGVACLALAALLAWQGRASVHETVDAAWFVGILLALVVPGLVLVRRGWRALEDHPLLRAITASPAWIDRVEVVYTRLQGGGQSARVVVHVHDRGLTSLQFDRADGDERALAAWILGRREMTAQAA